MSSSSSSSSSMISTTETQTQTEVVEVRDSNRNEQDSSNISDINNKNSNNNMSDAQCNLCRDTITTATVCPCGHVYCWSCLLQLAANRSKKCFDAKGRILCLINCPDCRHEFPIQKIRVIYGY